jgi:hypothetical protein
LRLAVSFPCNSSDIIKGREFRVHLHNGEQQRVVVGGNAGGPLINVLGPAPGVDVMAKGPQGLLNVATLSRGLLAVSGVTAGVARGDGTFFSPASRGALRAALGLFGCN